MRVNNNYIVKEVYPNKVAIIRKEPLEITEIKNKLENINLNNSKSIKDNNRMSVNRPKQHSVSNLNINMKNAIEAYRKVSPDSEYSDKNLSYELQKKTFR